MKSNSFFDITNEVKVSRPGIMAVKKVGRSVLYGGSKAVVSTQPHAVEGPRIPISL